MVGPAPPSQGAAGAGSAVTVRGPSPEQQRGAGASGALALMRPSPEQQRADGARLAIDVSHGVSEIRGAGVSRQPEAASGGREATEGQIRITPSEDVAPSAAYGSGDSKVDSPSRRVSSPPWRSPWE